MISSQDARWTWTSHYSFGAARVCAVEHGSAYASEAEVMLLSEADVRAILPRGVSKKRPSASDRRCFRTGLGVTGRPGPRGVPVPTF